MSDPKEITGGLTLPPPFPEEYLTEIGRVAFEWSRLERNVEVLITEYMGKTSLLEVVALTAHLGLRERLGALQAIIRINYGDSNADLLTPIVNRITESLSKRRSKIVHWRWKISDDDPRQAEVSSIIVRGGRFKIEPEKMPLADITSIARDIRLAGLELWALLEKITGQGDQSVRRLFESLRDKGG